MINKNTPPDNFLWVLRALTTAFLIGYLASIYLAVVVAEWFPTENTLENLLATGLLLVFGLAYYLMWMRREGFAAILFILWFASLWPMELFIGGERWEDAPVPGIMLFILAILLLVYRLKKK